MTLRRTPMRGYSSNLLPLPQTAPKCSVVDLHSSVTVRSSDFFDALVQAYMRHNHPPWLERGTSRRRGNPFLGSVTHE